jgi:GT2 family glycosyltransferase
MIKKRPDISVIVLNFNTKNITIDCLKSVLEKTKDVSFEIILVDNNSTDGSKSALGKYAKAIEKIELILNNENSGFTGGNNIGIKRAKGRYVLLLNSDTLLFENSLKKMVEFMDKNPKVGVSTCKLLNTDGTNQGSGGYFPYLHRLFTWMFFIDDLPFISALMKSVHPKPASELFNTKHEQDWVTGAFFLIRSETVKDVGLLDDDFFMYVEDLEYCYRVKSKGWKVFYTPETAITHIGGASGASVNTIVREIKNLKLFYKKHRPFWETIVAQTLLKLGCLARIIVFGLILQRREKGSIYTKAFRQI